jgi:hypothetical protein
MYCSEQNRRVSLLIVVTHAPGLPDGFSWVSAHGVGKMDVEIVGSLDQ